MLSVCRVTGPVAATCTLSSGAPDASVMVTVTLVGVMFCAGAAGVEPAFSGAPEWLREAAPASGPVVVPEAPASARTRQSPEPAR